MRRYFIAFNITALVYASIGVMLWYQTFLKTLGNNTPVSKTTVMHVYVPKALPKLETPHIEPTIPTTQTSIKTPVAKPVATKVKQRIEAPKPIEKAPAQTQESLEAVPIADTLLAEQKQQQTPISAPSNAADEKRHAYVARLLERINAHKVYPKVAQRSHIEGEVTVEFTVSPMGDLVSLNIVEGKQIFHKATKEAFYKSFPCPMNEHLFNTDTTFRIALSYTLL